MNFLDQIVAIANRKRGLVNNSHPFHAGSEASILASDLKTVRAKVTISHVPNIWRVTDPCVLHFKDELPSTVCAGDYIMVEA